ncbi:hypothetical protein [Phenylobacterium sp. J367]|uniref:hypothetical protein n=1 Tax=Phenylobacterium sp. J367 TaxID=2898435 RepID=UPI0021517D92|nr:hypothetical protein [Phenylobacterium sp. J367]MCR5877485.1 hypothetical protein [Phenylobacterium sp. J367]
MKKASEYRVHAAECRALAAGMPGGAQRDQLMAMAENWDAMASERVRLIERYPELALAGEIEEEDAA